MRASLLAAPLALVLLAAGAGAQSAAPAPDRPATQRTVAAGDTVRGTVTVAGRPLVVHGVIEGDAISLGGDVVLERGGRVTGDAIAFGGRVVNAGGVIGKDAHSFAFGAAREPRAAERSPSTWRSVKVALTWFAILAAIGIGVLLFAEGTIEPVAETVGRQFGRSFRYGLLAQLAILPGALLVVVALALTIVGVLLVPFAVVAYAIAIAGVLTLGFLAVARFTGGAPVAGLTGNHARSRHLTGLVRGLLLYLGVWVVAAALTELPLAAAVARAIALAVTWVAVTLGLGAAIVQRLESHRSTARKPAPMDPMVWQTPTPVTGVAAARRARKPVSADAK